MSEVQVRIINQDLKFDKVGDVVEMRETDARYLAALGRVEYVQDEQPAAATYEEQDKDELESEAERRGLDVERADGKDGKPLKSDYIAALEADDQTKG